MNAMRHSPALALVLAFLAPLVGPLPAARAQAPAAAPSSERQQRMDEELRYVAGLQEWGLQEYAVEVINRLKTEYPEIGPLIKVAELRGLLGIGKFDEVKAIVARQPDPNSQETWAMKLALADGYYAFGRYAEAQGIYESFFKAYASGPTDALNDFYRDSAYKYAQMLLLMNKGEAALDAYRTVLKAKIEKHVKRQMQGEMAEQMIKLGEKAEPAKRKALFDEARKLTAEIMWVRDLWFGRGVVFLAHMKMIEGDAAGAQKLVDNYAEDLKAIHDALVEQSKDGGEDLTRMSPMAQCRYMLGVMMQDGADKALKAGDRKLAAELLAGKDGGPGALQHFFNVFIRFPTSQWAAEAGVRGRQVQELLKREFNAVITIPVTKEQWDRVRQNSFQQARSLFNQQQFEPAVESYINVLTLFPEGETSVQALGELCRCYVELNDETSADTVAGYLGERFAESKDLRDIAGDTLLGIASFYDERQMPDKREATYSTFFAHYSKHPRISGLLFMFGDERYNRKDYAGAIPYFERVRKEYPEATAAIGALSRIAQCHEEMGNRTNEIVALTEMVKAIEKKERPGYILITTKFRLASAYRGIGGQYLGTAYNQYAELVKLLQQPGTQFYNTKDEQDGNQRVLEGSLFYMAICLSQMKPTEEQVPVYRRKSIDALGQLVQQFPKSAFAPASLSQIGTLHILLEEPDKAREALDKLRKNYPESDEAKNATYVLANSLLKLGFREKATAAFKEMFEGSGQFSAAQVLTAGQELLKSGEAEIALQAYDRVLKTEKDRNFVEPATAGRGRALFMLGRQAEAMAVLKDFLGKFPTSGYTVPVCLALSQSYAELGMKEADAAKRQLLFNDSVKAINQAKKYEKSLGGGAELNLGVARIYVRKAAAEQQFGTPATVKDARGLAAATYQTIMLGDHRNGELREYIEVAFHECIPLLLTMERWQDAYEDSGRYLELFPGGAKFASDIRGYRTQARVKLATTGALGAVAAAAAAGGDTNLEQIITVPDAVTNAPAATNAAPVAGKTP